MTSARIPSSRSQACSLVRATLALSLWLSAPLAAAQSQLWIRQLGTGFDDAAFAAAPDASGGVYVGGWTAGNLGGPNAGSWKSTDAWLARYDFAGNRLWLRQFGTDNYDNVNAAAPDASGGVYATGFTIGSLGGPKAGYVDAWLARYDGTGNQLWVRQLGTSAWDAAIASAPDASGGVYLSGGTGGSLGGSNAGDADAWLARYDSAGNQLWIRQLGTNREDIAWAAAPDASGGV